MDALINPTNLIDGVILTQLKQIYHPKGDIFHALKASENDSFEQFGEAYFTTIKKGITKGWKKHQVMQMNLIVPVGLVTFYIFDEDSKRRNDITIGKGNYARLTIDSGLWVAFKGLDEPLNLILNIASIEHEAEESVNMPLNHFSLPQS